MNSAMNRNQAVVRGTHPADGGFLSQERGFEALRWLGLVAGTPPANHDELASQSLTAARPVDDTSHWIA
ncbi:MAG: hypothetical protein LC745_11575 [Planctomycetia bacterium]|nr:hypothetical protein [Planctomycetia bacterium]